MTGSAWLMCCPNSRAGGTPHGGRYTDGTSLRVGLAIDCPAGIATSCVALEKQAW